MLKRFICFIILCMASTVVSATTVDVIIQWEAPKTFESGQKLNSQKDILFYTVYYGKSPGHRENPGSFDRMIVVPPHERFVLIEDLEKTRYYFWATATSVELEESRPSNVIRRNFERRKFARPIILIVNEKDDEDEVCSSIQEDSGDDC